MGYSTQCYMPSFVKIDLPVLEKKIFEWSLPYMGVVAILGKRIKSFNILTFCVASDQRKML